MKAKTVCPKCRETVYTDCRGCIEAGILVHNHGEDEPDFMNVEWDVLEYP